MSDPIGILRSFYDALSGASWEKNDNWCSSAPIQQWFGVLTDEEGNLIGLELRHNNLSGSLPAEIFQIRTLRTLNLCGNKIVGNIPDSLDSGSAIESLNLSKNRLGGPLSLSTVSKIALMKCRESSSVVLSMNGGFHLPQNLGDLDPQMQTLNLSKCSLIGPIPESLGKLTTLSFIDFSSNALEGPIPGSIGNLSSLSVLRLQGNSLSGDLPTSLSKLTSLTEFIAYQNKFTGCLEEGVGNLKKLAVLVLNNNAFDGELSVGAVALISRLYSERNGMVDLSECKPGFSLPGNIDRVVSYGVRRINLSRCSLRGDVPSSFGQLLDLEHINLSGNLLSGVLPVSFIRLLTKNSSRWPQVLSGNSRHKDSQASAVGDTPDKRGMVGLSLPDEIDQLGQDINALDLSKCSLVGFIPAKIGDLQSLTILNLSGNSLAGSIPASICFLEGLNFLDLSGNALDGPIPAGIGKLKSLVTLNLSSNYLSGNLPSTFGELGRIEVIILSKCIVLYCSYLFSF